MARTRASAKAAGAKTERVVADYLAQQLSDDRIDRRVKTGAKDRGDITGLRIKAQRVVVEVKDCARYELGTWLTETEIERLNDDATAGFVVAKRRGRGHPGDLLVAMTLDDLIALLTGERPARKDAA